MARARNIKPGFFRNADLVDLPFETRLLFIGLWTIADRAGRLEDRPKQIKMEIFPADNLDCDAMLNQLAEIGVIDRYEAAGKRFIQIINFDKHQNPHRDEKESSIPPRGAEQQSEHCEHGANTVQAPCEHGANTVAIGLIPDSLIPDSLNLSASAERVALEHELSPSHQPSVPTAPSAKRGTRLPAAWQCPDDWVAEAMAIRPGWSRQDLLRVADGFRDYWIAVPGTKGLKSDWRATWRNWCRNQRDPPANVQLKSIHDARSETIAILTGKRRHEPPTAERDITADCVRIG